MITKPPAETSPTDQVTIQEWTIRGALAIRTEALSISDPDHPYNQILAQDKIPEEFGVYHPITEEFQDKPRQHLINEIVKLRQEIESLYRSGMC